MQMTRWRLRKELNLVTLVAVMIGLNVGGSLFVLTAITAGITGPSLVIAQVISSLPVLLALVPYLVFTSAFPTTCANYHYAKLFSPPLAVVGWWGLFVAIPVGALPLFAIATAKLLAIIWPGIPIIGTALAVMTLFYLLNILGIKSTAYVQLAAVALLIGAVAVFVVPGIPAIDAANLTPLFTGGAMGLIASSALLFTLLAGALFGIEMGDEVKDARRTIPRALIISTIIVAIMYLLVELVAVGAVNWRVFAEAGTLGRPAEAFLPPALLNFFIVGGGVLAATTTINLTLTAAGRYAMASAEDRFLPHFFSHVNRRFGTPHWGLTLPYVLSFGTLLVNPPLETLAAMLNFGLLFMVTVVLLSAMRLHKAHPEILQGSSYKFKKRTIVATSLAAAIINVFFMVILTIALPVAFMIYAGACVFGIAVYFIRKRAIESAPVYLPVVEGKEMAE
jgi:APA family basic amino acid/polyamine antiporter